ATQPATLCSNCGVIEGVREVRREGQGTGLGAVAGGVLGGVVGHQLGGGNGKTALTVLGAIGGGLAGNEIEKRQRAVTLYEVRVRMDDGTVRSFTQASAPAPGTHVTVDGQGVHVAGRAGAPAPEYVRVSTGAGS
ncbi:MAG: glycine zipper 2TM domain-containing protein, partial [Burkholderiales bacterium]|nr:glycine zipper 2TM domain-containing protein [Burkholderiales bacterium]